MGLSQSLAPSDQPISPAASRPHAQVGLLTIAAFLALIAGAIAIRWVTFERYLPYLDYGDEGVPFVIALNWRGIEQNEYVAQRYAGYPPAYVLVNIGVQQLGELTASHPWVLPTEHIYHLRLLAVIVGVITTLVIIGIGWQLAGSVAGWLAGFVWAFAPVIVEHNSLALPDPFVYLTCAVAVAAALRAWIKESPGWLTVSLISGILAIYFKLWPIHAVVPWGVVTLSLLRRQPKRVLPWVTAYLVIAAASALLLFIAVRPLDLPAREIETFKGDGLAFILTPSRHFNNWYYAIYPVGMGLFVGVIVLGGLAYLYSRPRHWRILNWQHIGLLVLYSFLGIAMSTSFTQVWLGAGKIRHVLPISLALIPLWAAALVQIGWTVQNWLEKPQQRRFKQLPAVLTTALAGILAVSFVPGNSALLKQYELTPMPVLFWRWTDTNVPLEGLIMTPLGSEVATTWNRHWSGYDGGKPFQWWQEPEGDILQYTPEQLVRRNILYFAFSEKDRSDLYADRLTDLDAFLDQFTLVKTIPTNDKIIGSTVYFYRVPAPQYPAQIVFGGQIQLVGYDLNTTELKAGNTLKLRPYWRIQRKPDTNYSMFVHLYPAEADQLIVQNDGPPTSLNRLTLTWDDPQEVYIGADFSLSLPADLAPGPYRLVLGLYDFSTGQRLTTGESKNAFSIPIEIPKN